MHPFRLSPVAVPSVSAAVDDIRPPSRYHGRCAVCREPVVGQELVRVHGEVLHAGCSTGRRDRERPGSL